MLSPQGFQTQQLLEQRRNINPLQQLPTQCCNQHTQLLQRVLLQVGGDIDVAIEFLIAEQISLGNDDVFFETDSHGNDRQCEKPESSPSHAHEHSSGMLLFTYCRLNQQSNGTQYRGAGAGGVNCGAVGGGGKTVRQWLKDRKEKKKEETRANNAQVYAAVSVAAAAIAALVVASAKDQETARTYMVVASAATLVAAQCVEAAEAMGEERDHVASVVRSAGDIMTLTTAAATASAFGYFA